MLTNKEIRETICPLINLVQLKQVLSMYQHDEMLEDPVPITLIYSIVHLPGIGLKVYSLISSDYNLEDPLVWDVGTLLPIEAANLHFLEYSDLNIIPFPSNLKAELEEVCTND